MRVSAAVLASTAVLGLLAGCSGGAEPTQPSQPGSANSASSEASAPTSSAPTSASASPSATAASPAKGTTEVSAADGTLTWTMPCANPRDEKIKGNEEDAKRFRDFHAWACGKGPTATAGVLVAELKEAPADDDEAHRNLAEGLGGIVKTGKPEHGTFLGHPGVTQEAELNGRSVAYQGVSYGKYLALFFTIPGDDLATLTDTVTIDG
jgi:hypothetical protein